MTPNDDEVLARLRASLQAAAAQTPISDGRLPEITLDTVGRRSNALVISMSAAAAVAVIGGVTAVAASSGSHSSGVPALADAGSSTAPAAPSTAPVESSTAPAAPSSAGNPCVPDNYYVIASAAEVAPYTYILPAVPAGYQLYGAWGTIDRQKCAGTTTFYVEYDDAAGYGNTDSMAIQLSVSAATAKPGGLQALGNSSASATPSGVAASSSSAPAGSVWTQVPVGADVGRFAAGKASFGTLIWTHGDLIFQLNAPDPGGDVSTLTSLAESLVHVSPTDPRIKAPANCQVQPGNVCPG